MPKAPARVRYELVIFDFDGTLADSARWMRGAIDEVAKKHGFRTIVDEEVEELRGKDTRAIMAQLGVRWWKLPFIARSMRALMARDAHLVRPFPGVPELLAELTAAGIVVAIVSSNAEANVRVILGPSAAAQVRFYACGAGLFAKRKKFREVLRKSGVPASRAIAIGDEVRDIDAARSEHIATAAVTWGYAAEGLLRARQPTVTVESLDALRALLVGPT